MSFYSETKSAVLRQGDIVTGLPILTPEKRGDPIVNAIHDYNVNVRVCHCAVITPCCSIEEGKLVLSPLRELLASMLAHEAFGPNPLRINGRVDPIEAFGPAKWAQLSAAEQAEHQAEGSTFALLHIFVYDEHPLLPTYVKRGRELRYYWIDFRTTFLVQWDKIRRDDPAGNGIKLAELSVEARETFRQKLTHFYGRRPPEDEAVLAVTQ